MRNKLDSKGVAQRLRACPLSISRQHGLKAVLYKESALIAGWPSWYRKHGKPAGCSTRNIIGDMSRNSAKRLLFTIANASFDFGVMATLTFQVMPVDFKAVFRRWVRLMRYSGLCWRRWLWVMEFQERGAVHWHVLFSRDDLSRAGFLNPRFLEHVTRHGRTVSLLRGPFQRAVVDAWIAAVRNPTPEFIHFQNGGIVEILAQPDSAARYFAPYLSKKEQKSLPKEISAAGRWWWASPECKPRAEMVASLEHWPFMFPFRLVFNKRELNGCLTDWQDADELGINGREAKVAAGAASGEGQRAFELWLETAKQHYKRRKKSRGGSTSQPSNK